MEAKLTTRVLELGRLLQKAGPYVVLEIVLPGGTLFALLLYLYRTGQLRRVVTMPLRLAGRAFDQLAFTLQPLGAVPGPRRDGLEPLSFVSGSR